jgi:hypothetical protein
MDSSSVHDAIPSMSAEDVQLLADVAIGLKTGLASVATSMACYGAYLVVAGMAFYTVIRRPQLAQSTAVLLGCLALTFAVSTVFMGLNIYLAFEQYQRTFIDNITLPFAERVDSFSSIQRIATISELLGGSGDSGPIFLLNDILAIWRATVICSPTITFMNPILCFLAFVSFALYITYMVISLMQFRHPNATIVSNANVFAIIPITSSACSISVNVFATAMIGYVAYHHRGLYKRGLPRFRAMGALIFLMESGMLYAALQIIRIAVALEVVPETLPTSSLFIANRLWQDGGAILSVSFLSSLICASTFTDVQLLTGNVHTRAYPHYLSPLLYRRHHPDEYGRWSTHA